VDLSFYERKKISCRKKVVLWAVEIFQEECRESQRVKTEIAICSPGFL
jgi:hypothetical protein